MSSSAGDAASALSRAGHLAPSAGRNGPTGPATIQGRKKVYRIRNSNFAVDPNYEVVKAIGVGAYGLVCSAIDHTDGTGVAIKKVANLFDDLVDGKRVLRELRTMRLLGSSHSSVLDLKKILCPVRDTEDEMNNFHSVYFVTRLMETDLSQILKSRQALTFEHHSFFAYQMLRGIAFVHSAGVVHRDLKPANILMDASCALRIGDFGLARVLPVETQCQASPITTPRGSAPPKEPDAEPFDATAALTASNFAADAGSPRLAPPRTPAAPQDGGNANDDPFFMMTEYVVTRWYRAPEVLVLAAYGRPVDVWSVGCLLVEILQRRPLFAGNDYLQQLKTIINFVEVPMTEPEMKAIFPGLRRQQLDILLAIAEEKRRTTMMATGGRQRTTSQSLYANFDMQPEDCSRTWRRVIDLMSSLLSFNASSRPTAASCLRHEYFGHLRRDPAQAKREDEANVHRLPPGCPPLDVLFEFESIPPDGMTQEKLRQLFWEDMTDVWSKRHTSK